ncbi:MAG: hypothetical protein ACXWP5_06830 [Bdellovibrionota bacterium]
MRALLLMMIFLLSPLRPASAAPFPTISGESLDGGTLQLPSDQKS